MKRYGKLLFTALTALLTVLLLAAVLVFPAVAETADAGEDLLVFDADNKIVTERVEGDLLALSNALIVQGEVQGSIRAFAAEIKLQSAVHRNVTVAGGIIESSEDFSANDVVIAGGQVVFRGECETLSIYGETVIIGGTVHGELVCSAKQVILLESADFVSANIVSSSEPVVKKQEADLDYKPLAGSAFADRVTFEKTQSELVSDLIELPFTLLTGVVLALVIALLFGRVADRVSLRFHARPVPFCLKGFAAVVLVPLAAIFLILPVVTVPVSGALLLVYLLFWLVSKALTAAILGRLWLARWNPYLSAALIAAVIAVLSVIPIVGGLITFFCGMVSFGTAVSLLMTRQEEKQDIPADMDFRV